MHVTFNRLRQDVFSDIRKGTNLVALRVVSKFIKTLDKCAVNISYNASTILKGKSDVFM